MLLPTIRSLATAIKELENSVQEPEIERLEVWRKLIIWFNYARNYDNEREALAALSPGDKLSEIRDDLIWVFRHFAGAIPDEARIKGWLEKSKLCFEAFICGSLQYIDENRFDRGELMREEYLDECIAWTIEQLQDADGWAEYDEQIAQQEIESQIGTRRYQARQGSAEALNWLRLHDPVFCEDDYEQKSVVALATTQPDEPRPATEPVIIQAESKATNGEVSNNAIIARYTGGKVGFSIMTEDGLKKITKGETYRLPRHIWQNIEENEQTVEWEKV